MGNFGAGFDTLFWKLRDDKLKVENFVEFDFSNVTSRKCQLIRNSRPLMEAFINKDMNMRFNKNELHSKGYHLVAADLRKLSEVESKFQECQLEKSLPTLFLFECVLVYMPIASSSGLLKLIASLFPASYCISYEQVNMSDRFGDVARRQVHRQLLERCESAGDEPGLPLVAP